MQVQTLYDLSLLASLMWVGLALGPLAWVGYQHRRATPLRRFQALTLLTLFLTFDLVLFGAFTRLTDSGPGCPDWPGCYQSDRRQCPDSGGPERHAQWSGDARQGLG